MTVPIFVPAGAGAAQAAGEKGDCPYVFVHRIREVMRSGALAPVGSDGNVVEVDGRLPGARSECDVDEARWDERLRNAARKKPQSDRGTPE